MINLDANNPDQIVNPCSIAVDLTGEPGQKTLILSGIARPEWEVTDDGHLYNQTVDINLRQTALAVMDSAVSVGLASIGNHNTTFQFSCDSSDLTFVDNSQELHLIVNLGLRGDWSILNRFGYQVVAIVTTQVTGISGSIRWSRSMFDPSSLPPGELAGLFSITANQVTTAPGGGPFGGQPIYTVRATGVTTGLTKDKNDYIVGYSIPGGPYNQPLVVKVDASTAFTSHYPPMVSQVAGPNPVVLTTSQPGVTGVDFRVVNIVVK